MRGAPESKCGKCADFSRIHWAFTNRLAPEESFGMRVHAGKIAISLVLMLAALAAPALAATIRVTVNETAITDTQISQRAQLIRLEGRGSSANSRLATARNELIEDQLKLQEAERLGMTVSEAEVDAAVAQLAQGMRISTDNLNRVLTENGANPQVLRDRLRAQLAWAQISRLVISPRVQFSEIELEQQAAAQLQDSDGYDYVLKQVLFIIAPGSNMSQSQRTAQANQYRNSFQGCDSAVDLSLSYTDAAVLDVGRRHATQLPDAIAEELARLQVGGITQPRVGEDGVSMLAVCSKAEARDLTFVTGQVRQEVGSELLAAEAEKYLQNLRDQASIINH